MSLQNFEMIRGDSLTLRVTVTNDDGTPKNLTSAAIKWALGKTATSPVRLIEKSLAAGVQINDAAGGIFDVVLAPADTANLKGEYYHEAEITDSMGQVCTVMTGKATIKPALIP